MPSRKPAAETGAETTVPHDPMTVLVLLQDLDLLLRDATDPKQAEESERMGFKVKGVEEVRVAREVLAASVEPRVLRQYEAASKRYAGRAIVPLRNRICLGCSGLLPTGASRDPHLILTCQSCGRILYPL
jgi:predicted  nucleic acid-binding Zn-ribbon protein